MPKKKTTTPPVVSESQVLPLLTAISTLMTAGAYIMKQRDVYLSIVEQRRRVMREEPDSDDAVLDLSALLPDFMATLLDMGARCDADMHEYCMTFLIALRDCLALIPGATVTVVTSITPEERDHT